MKLLTQVILAVISLLSFGYFAMYNKKILRNLEKIREKMGIRYYKLFGPILQYANIQVTRTANLNKKSVYFKVYSFFEDILVNLDMSKDDVSVSGMLIFITSASLSGGVTLALLMKTFNLVIPITLAFMYLLITIFRLLALLKYEKREAEIMDAIDLLVSDIGGGVYNAILRYQDSFHPNIRPYFSNFIDDIQNKGYSFKQAMIGLNNTLGMNFTEFAQKAILYEEKADNTMEDIFSSIIEVNRQRRTLRYINNIKFAELRMQFMVSIVLIGGYALFTALLDPFILSFLTTNIFGKLMVIFDIALIAWVLSYMASVKAKSL